MCEICKQNPCVSRCPNYDSMLIRANHRCDSCLDWILDGELYIKNPDGKLRHLDCCCVTREFLNWMDIEIMIMEDVNE